MGTVLLVEMPEFTPVAACTELATRTDAEYITVTEQPNGTWSAEVRYPTALITVFGQPDPETAARVLAERILATARCRCGGAVALPATPTPKDATPIVVAATGTTYTITDTERAGTCRWRTRDIGWSAGCEDATAPEADLGQLSTVQRLCLALIEDGAPREMVEKARAGHYDEFRSRLAFPNQELVSDALANDLPGIALRAIEGEFDGTHEELQQWWQSPDGRQTEQRWFGTSPALTALEG